MGHEVCSLPLSKGANLEAEVNALCPGADLVLLELFGGHFPFSDMVRCKYRLAVYCIDSPLNEFWLEHIAKLADDVFTDQQSSIAILATAGIKACWLPLCVSEHTFREKKALKYDISFVGTDNAHRIKRSNILRCIKEYFPLNLQTKVSSSQMLDIFAESKISINENLFSGLTLRILQSMAAGTILFTEANNNDIHDLFEDGKELVYYEPDTLIPRLREVLENYPDYTHIARAGQELCRIHHTSKARANEFLGHITEKNAYNVRRSFLERRYHSACAEYLFSIRFGGYIGNARKVFQEIIEAGEPRDLVAQAALMLGDVYARSKHPQEACKFYNFSVENGGGVIGLIKNAIVQCSKKEFEDAFQILRCAITLATRVSTTSSAVASNECAPDAPNPLQCEQSAFLSNAASKTMLTALGDSGDLQKEALLLLVAARLFFEMGKINTLGFITPQEDVVPSSALPLAFKAWESQHSEEILDFILACGKRANIETELLPTLISSIYSLTAERRHILCAAELAYKNYDKLLSETLLARIRKC